MTIPTAAKSSRHVSMRAVVEAVVEAGAQHLGRCLLKPVPVVPSRLENRATLMGAIAMGLANLYGSVFGARSFPGATAKDSEAA